MRSGYGPQYMAVFRHIAMSLMRTTKRKSSLKPRRKEAAWNADDIGAILRDAIAVGTVIADPPPHRARRALLTHRAPTSRV